MSTRTSNDVTLPHDTANTASRLLASYASDLEAHAKRTRSEPVRWGCRNDAEKCRRIADLIVKNLYTWTA